MPLPHLLVRASDSHKGDYGRALLIGGSVGMAGAISLSGMAALRAGAGLVKLAVPEACLGTVASFEPCYMTVPLPADERGRIGAAAEAQLLILAEEATAAACGPGLGRSHGVTSIVLSLYAQTEKPLVIDADGLNALATSPAALSKHRGARILTPHPGEFARLIEVDDKILPDQRRPLAEALARKTGAVIVLKGHRTVVTDGQRTEENTTGNPGMATGGTGDVLTGIITALLCQGLSPFDAAHFGAHVHGLAGDLAAAQFGQMGMIARDLIDNLPQALRTVAQ